MKNQKENLELIKYLAKNSELRVWQNIRNWSKANYVLKSTHFDASMFNKKYLAKNKVEIGDTFYENI